MNYFNFLNVLSSVQETAQDTLAEVAATVAEATPDATAVVAEVADVVNKTAPNDLTGFTFWLGAMAMMAASVFFFFSLNSVDKKWRNSILVSGLITFIAAVHYMYMRDAHAGGDSTTVFRYIDWILTVPLMCVEFYLILKVAGATKSHMWKLIFFSTVMLVTGFFGESGWDGEILNAWQWGLISGLAYFYIAYEVWLGSLRKLAESAGGNVLAAHKMLCWFLLVGWAIYPLGYMAGTDGWYDGIENYLPAMDVVYNVGDAINKIGFGLVVYSLAVKES
jgi:sensory rhodopsin